MYSSASSSGQHAIVRRREIAQSTDDDSSNISHVRNVTRPRIDQSDESDENADVCMHVRGAVETIGHEPVPPTLEPMPDMHSNTASDLQQAALYMYA